MGYREEEIAWDIEMLICNMKTGLAERVGEREIKLDEDLRRDVGADSLDCVELAFDVENKYDIKIPDEDLLKIRTFGDLVDYVSKHASLEPQTQS